MAEGCGNGGEAVVVAEDIILGYAELEVEDIEELALDAANVPLAKDTRAHGPVDILEGGVVQVLGCDDEGAEEYSLGAHSSRAMWR